MTQPSNRRLLTESQAAPLSSAAPVRPSVTPVGGSSLSVARSDHSHPAAGLFAPFGDGSLGDVVLDGTSNRTGFDRVGTVYTATQPIHANDLSIASGVTLRPAGWIINVLGTLSGAGVIQAASGKTTPGRWAQLRPGAVGAAGGAGVGGIGVEITPNAEFGVPGTSGAGGAGSGGAGGGGVFTNTNFVIAGFMVGYLRHPHTAFYGVAQIGDWAQNPPTMTVSALAGGPSGGAGGGGGGNGGKGGDGGQVIIVNARRIMGSVNISAPGENGGAAVGTNAGGGGGGVGGLVILNTIDNTLWTGALSAPGGLGGAKLGTGVAGGAGAAGITRLNVWA